MGIFTRTRPVPARIEPVLAAPETRAFGRYSDGWGAVTLGSGGGSVGAVPTYIAENLSSVTGAVELMASGIASLPASLQVDTPDGRKPAPATASAGRILSRPNPWMSWPAFASNVVAELLLNGNSLSYVVRDGRGAPVSLIPVPWSFVNPMIVRGGAGARLVFDVIHTTPEAELLGLPRRMLDVDVMHIRARGGVIGRSVIQRAASVIREALAVQETAAGLWQNQLRPSATLSTDQALTSEARLRLRASTEDFVGPGATGKLLVLANGLTFKPVSMSSVDAEMLATRRLTVDDVARLFCIPAGMLQAGQTSNAAPAELQAQFAMQALTPVVNLIEAEFDEAILPAGTHLQLDLGGLMRGSYSALVGAQSVALQAGALTANDVRRSIGLPALPGGDDLRAPGAVPGFPADAKGVPSLAPKPGPGGDLPNAGTNQNEGAG